MSTRDDRQALLRELSEAMPLSERASLPKPVLASRFDETLADTRLTEWQRQRPFDDESVFRQRCATLPGGIERLRLALGACDFADAAAGYLGWAVRLGVRLGAADSTRPWEKWPEANDATYLLGVFSRVLNSAYSDLEGRLDAIQAGFQHLSLDRAVLEPQLQNDLAGDVFDIADRALVAEMHVARTRGELRGATPRERFRYYVEAIMSPSRARDFLSRYPVLARMVDQLVESWLESTIEAIVRLDADLPALRDALLFESFGPLQRLRRAGDRHQGRRVLLCDFGPGKFVVYKPRHMDLERAFAGLVAWFNSLDSDHELRAPRIVARDGYGWAEFIPHVQCGNERDLKRFYRASGQLLALLHATAAIDIHAQNVVACGRFPVVVDAESIMQPDVYGDSDPDAAPSADDAARLRVQQSVMRTGLLPVRALGRGASFPAHSGIAGFSGPARDVAMRQWVDIGTDAMRAERRLVAATADKNQPTDSLPTDVAGACLAEILDGFRGAYRSIYERRRDVRAAGGPLDANRPTKARVIIRPTHSYEMLQRESTHPSLLATGLSRDLFFDKLWLLIPRRPRLAAVVAAEHAALVAGDVPRFESTTSSRDIDSANGVIEGFLARSADEVLATRLESLGPDDLALQEWIAATAVIASEFNSSGRVLHHTSPVLSRTVRGCGASELIAAASDIADRLAQLAIRTRDGITWLGISASDGDKYEIAPLHTDLYDGLPGVIIFLSYLARLTSEPRFLELARGAFATLKTKLDAGPSLDTIGAYVGYGGLVYLYAHIAHLWDDPCLLRDAEGFVDQIEARVSSDEHLDVLSGAAGAIGSLLCLHDLCPTGRALDVALACADHLVRRRDTLTAAGMVDNGHWRTPGLTGFSHGAAGIAWALRRVVRRASAVRDRSLREIMELAEAALAHERRTFDEAQSNWPDKRATPENQRPPFVSFWCHGGPGIGLSRLGLYREGAEPQLLAELRASVVSTLSAGFGHSHCLCHGDLGNLELLQAAVEHGVLSEEAYGTMLSAVVEGARSAGIRCGTACGAEHPGLMVGLAGVGHGLLRLAKPEIVPSVLRLEGPRVTRAEA